MESLPELSQKYSAPVFETLDDLLASDTELDGVVIGTNHASHHVLATACMEAGLHVFCEKPMTVDIDEAKVPPAAPLTLQLVTTLSSSACPTGQWVVHRKLWHRTSCR